MEFSEKVKEIRGILLLSQEELAKQIGVSRITITRWETLGYVPKYLTFKKFETFCKSKGISIS